MNVACMRQDHFGTLQGMIVSSLATSQNRRPFTVLASLAWGPVGLSLRRFNSLCHKRYCTWYMWHAASCMLVLGLGGDGDAWPRRAVQVSVNGLSVWYRQCWGRLLLLLLLPCMCHVNKPWGFTMKHVDWRTETVTVNGKGAARAVFALERRQLRSAEKTCPGSPATAPETAAAPWAFGSGPGRLRHGMSPVSHPPRQAEGTCPSSPWAERCLPVPENPPEWLRPAVPVRERGEKGDPLGMVCECGDEAGVQTPGAKHNRTWGTEGFPQPCSVSPQQGQMAELLTSLNSLLHSGLPPSSHKRKTSFFATSLWHLANTLSVRNSF